VVHLLLQAKRKYLNPEEVPDWMRYSKKELEEKQKQEAEARRKARKKKHKRSSSSSDSGTTSSSTSSGSTSSSSSGEQCAYAGCRVGAAASTHVAFGAWSLMYCSTAVHGLA
jgi:hypothetical protein